MTLAEHDALLKDEGRYDGMKNAQRLRDLKLECKAAEWQRAEAPLVDRLRREGLELTSAWDLVNVSAPYPDALPILLEHLQRPYPDRVREGIARALAVPESRFGWETLTRLYRQEALGTDTKDGLAVAIAAASDDEVIRDVISLARDATHGESRLLLLGALSRSEDPHARASLEELTEDSDVGKEARRILGVR